MKETKVWIDGEFPQVYFDPKTRNESIEGRPLILEDIKIHDRELVKEVCEKIREHLSEQKKSLKDTFSPYSNGKAFIISAVEDNLNKIEKEFEDGE